MKNSKDIALDMVNGQCVHGLGTIRNCLYCMAAVIDEAQKAAYKDAFYDLETEIMKAAGDGSPDTAPTKWVVEKMGAVCVHGRTVGYCKTCIEFLLRKQFLAWYFLGKLGGGVTGPAQPGPKRRQVTFAVAAEGTSEKPDDQSRKVRKVEL